MANDLPGWLPDWLKEALSKPTMSIPDAGRALGFESRTGSYDAARRGDIPTLNFGRKQSVPTAWVRRQLMLDEPVPPVRVDLEHGRTELPRRA